LLRLRRGRDTGQRTGTAADERTQGGTMATAGRGTQGRTGAGADQRTAGRALARIIGVGTSTEPYHQGQGGAGHQQAFGHFLISDRNWSQPYENAAGRRPFRHATTYT
jgi:hypothetical protein